MKKKQHVSIYLFLLIGSFLVFANSCEKEDDDKGKTIGNTFTDARDGNVYTTVTIGNQVWMAENLKYLPDVVGPSSGSENMPLYYVYGYDGTNLADAKSTANYDTYGVLYNWEAARTACPSGWHLPDEDEWAALIDYLGETNIAGGMLKETGTSHWASPNTGATNETGFTALPGGDRNDDGTFTNVGDYGIWWSTTEYDTNGEYIGRYVYYDNSSIVKYHYGKELGFSVRCVKD